MFCSSCQVTFAFYLKYCRQCGKKLVKETSIKSSTFQMLSPLKGADTGRAEKKYVTSPITQEIGKSPSSVAEVLQNIMNEFPSLDTKEMVNIFPPLYVYKGRMSNTDQMRATLREFDITELQELERSSGFLATVEAEPYKVGKKVEKNNGTQTIEFKQPSAYLGETQPLTSPPNNWSSSTSKTKYVLDSDRLHSTRTLPTKLYLPSSEKLMKLANTSSNSNKSLAKTFRQTLSNLWVRMRDLAENLSVSFSVRKNA